MTAKYKYKDIIKQGKEETLKKYEDLTEWNAHGEAIRLMCEYFKEEKLINIMEHINALHDIYGHLPRPLGQLRDEVLEEIRPKYYKHFKNIDITKYQDEPF